MRDKYDLLAERLDDTYTLEGVGALAKCSVDTIRNWVRGARKADIDINLVKVGRRPGLVKEDVIKLLRFMDVPII